MSAFSGARGLSGEIWAAAGLIRASVQEKLVYRFDLLVTLVRNLILITIFRFLWLSLYGGQAEFGGVSLNQTLTYATLGIILSPLFPNSLILDVGGRIRSGNILFDISRPLHFGSLLLYQMMGQFVAALATSAAPSCSRPYPAPRAKAALSRSASASGNCGASASAPNWRCPLGVRCMAKLSSDTSQPLIWRHFRGSSIIDCGNLHLPQPAHPVRREAFTVHR